MKMKLKPVRVPRGAEGQANKTGFDFNICVKLFEIQYNT